MSYGGWRQAPVPRPRSTSPLGVPRTGERAGWGVAGMLQEPLPPLSRVLVAELALVVDVQAHLALQPLTNLKQMKFSRDRLRHSEYHQCNCVCAFRMIISFSPDGITECETIACEIICLARKAHTELLVYGILPKDKLCQNIHYFTVNPKLEKYQTSLFKL